MQTANSILSLQKDHNAMGEILGFLLAKEIHGEMSQILGVSRIDNTMRFRTFDTDNGAQVSLGYVDIFTTDGIGYVIFSVTTEEVNKPFAGFQFHVNDIPYVKDIILDFFREDSIPAVLNMRLSPVAQLFLDTYQMDLVNLDRRQTPIAA
jgi:hypothetical protein